MSDLLRWVLYVATAAWSAITPQQAATPEYCIVEAQLHPNMVGTFPAWAPPNWDRLAGPPLDLRGQNPGPVGYYAVRYEDVGLCTDAAVMVNLGTDLDRPLRVAELNTISARLGRGQITSATVGDLLIDLYTIYADPLRLTAPGPIEPDSGMTVHLHIGGVELTRTILVGGPEWTNILAGIRQEYRRRLNDPSLANDHQWLLWEYSRRYGMDPNTFIPSDLPKSVSPRRPGTQFTDDFEVDSSADYTAECGTFTVDASNNGYLEPTGTGCASGSMNARDNTALGSNDMYAEVTIDSICTGGDTCGAGINMQDGGDDGMFVFYIAPSTAIQVYTYITSFNLVQTCVGSSTHTTGDSYGVRRDADNSIHCFKNDVEQGSPGSESTLTQTNFAGLSHLGLGVATDYEAFFWDDFISVGARRVIIID